MGRKSDIIHTIMSIRSKMVLAFSAFAIFASAREVTSLFVDVASETATVSFAGGVVGETNAVYLAWSDD